MPRRGALAKPARRPAPKRARVSRQPVRLSSRARAQSLVNVATDASDGHHPAPTSTAPPRRPSVPHVGANDAAVGLHPSTTSARVTVQAPHEVWQHADTTPRAAPNPPGMAGSIGNTTAKADLAGHSSGLPVISPQALESGSISTGRPSSINQSGRLDREVDMLPMTSDTCTLISTPLHSISPPQLPTNTHSSCVPLGSLLPMSIKEKIWQGMYVDFSLLFQENAATIMAMRDKNPELEFTLVGGRMVVKQAVKPRKKIDSLDKWQSAFHTFMSVYLMKHPDRWSVLLKYAEIVRSAALQFPGWGWKAYDEQFRLRQESNPAQSWGIVDSELWLTVAGAAVTSNYNSSSTFTPAASQTPKQGFCFAYNSYKGCHYKGCRFLHKCSRCYQSSHGLHVCRGSSAQAGLVNMKKEEKKKVCTFCPLEFY